MLLTVGGIVFLIGYMYLMMNLSTISSDAADGGSMIQNLLMNNTERITSMTKLFPPTAWAAEGGFVGMVVGVAVGLGVAVA